jgi:hypothetical protein
MADTRRKFDQEFKAGVPQSWYYKWRHGYASRVCSTWPRSWTLPGRRVVGYAPGEGGYAARSSS